MRFFRKSLWQQLAVISLLITGCGVNSTDELRKWMEEVKQAARPNIAPVPEPKKFDPFVYQLQDKIDPFNSVKLARVMSAAGPKRNTPNTDRRREPLEAFPLDQLKMVGTIRSGKLVNGLIEVDKILYPVKLGSYIGQNFGMVVSIGETEIKIKETIQDQMGEWMDRENTLVLQEAAK